MGRMGWVLVALLGLGWPALGLAAPVRPVVAVLGTCAALSNGQPYPADSTAWFDAGRHGQVVFYAHMLFPLRPLPGELDGLSEPWHPPLVSGTAGALEVADHFYAQADWTDPKGARVTLYGLTFTPRTRGDWVKLGGRDYIPHTFAMAIGTRDLRAGAGQLQLPVVEGDYNVRFSVDGRDVGLAMFRMLKPSFEPPKAAPLLMSPAAKAK
jgi:hypothetical protein